MWLNMYYVNKIVGWCLSPMGVLFVGLAVGMTLNAGNRRAFKLAGRWIVALVLVMFWVVSCGFSTRWIGLPLEVDEIDPGAEAAARNVEAIVLLGGGVGLHKQCGRSELFSGADRVWTAARMWKRLNVPMTVSGEGARGEMALLTEMGVETNRVISIEKARNTEEEAKFIKQAILARRPQTDAGQRPRIALVTSAWHMPRAQWLFERAGFDVVAAPTDYEMHYACEDGLRIRDLFPSGEVLERNSCAIKEWVALVCYRIKAAFFAAI